MKKTRQWIAMILILLLMAGCDDLSTTMPDYAATPVPGGIEPHNPAQDSAQATIDYGQRQLSDLAYQATAVSLNIDQAANTAAQATQDDHQRQKMALDYQSTEISQNITQAAVTQEFSRQQTQIFGEATLVAQNNAATVTQAAYLVLVNQTAQAQAVMDAQVQQTAQAVAALTAYPQTATPFAITQAALLMQQYDREQQSFIEKVVIPSIPFIVILEILLVMVLIFYVYRQKMLMPRLRRLYLAPIKLIPLPAAIPEHVILHNDLQPYPMLPADRTMDYPQDLAAENTLQVEIVDAAVLPVAHWVADAEHQLAGQKGSQP